VTTVLVTGAAGYIGGYLLPQFRERYTLRLVDNRDRDGLGRPVEGLQVRDVSDPSRMDEYRDLFRGADAVVHLAFMRPPEETLHLRYLAERANVDMAYIVYQLALEEGVRRVVVASSNHAADFYERPMRAGALELIRPDWPRPLADNFYGWAKESGCSSTIEPILVAPVVAAPSCDTIHHRRPMLQAAGLLGGGLRRRDPQVHSGARPTDDGPGRGARREGKATDSACRVT
jgi:hypothetical protein